VVVCWFVEALAGGAAVSWPLPEPGAAFATHTRPRICGRLDPPTYAGHGSASAIRLRARQLRTQKERPRLEAGKAAFSPATDQTQNLHNDLRYLRGAEVKKTTQATYALLRKI
jgi:hypothetical protein